MKLKNLPKGGLGNLIALPLQKSPRDKGNTVYVGDNFRPFEKQWEYLSNIKRLSLEEFDELISTQSLNSDTPEIQITEEDDILSAEAVINVNSDDLTNS